MRQGVRLELVGNGGSVIEDVLMPRLDQGMTEGFIESWLVEEGDLVHAGMAIVEIGTDKVTSVVEADASGTLLRIDVPAGSTVAVGTVIAWIGDEAAELPRRVSVDPDDESLADSGGS